MKRKTVIVIIMIFIALYGLNRCLFYRMPRSALQPPKELLEKDKKQIAESYVNLVEKYRQFYQEDLEKDTFVLAHIDVSGFYRYGERTNIYGEDIASPWPMHGQLEVTVDTIVYSSDKRFCVALLIIKRSFFKSEYVIKEKSWRHPYDGSAFIGYKKEENGPYLIYPTHVFSVIWMDTYDDVKEELRNYYFKYLYLQTGSFDTVFEQTSYKYNIGDSLFFEKAPFFQKYDSTRYNFQMFRYMVGRKGIFISEYMTNEGM